MSTSTFALLFLAQISSVLSQETSSLSNFTHSIEVAKQAHEIEKICYSALGNDRSKDLNNFAYGCFLKKFNETQKYFVIEDFKLCCNLFLSKNKHNENLGMGNRYCECLDMINIVHQPLIKECISSKLPQCKNTYSPWGHDDGLREDVGVILVYNQNVLLGGGGIAIFTILSLISLCGFGYLVFICILYRFCQNNSDEIQVAEIYAVTDAFEKYEFSEASTVAATATPQSATQTTQSITQIPPQQQQQAPSGSGNTKTKEGTNTISMEIIS